jgi:hypothetical protein
MKAQRVIVILSLALGIGACSKNGDIKAFVQENDALVKEITAASSADQARKVFDAKKADLKTKLEPLKNARGFQVNQESMTALTKSLSDGTVAVCGLQLKAVSDPQSAPAYKALCDEYTNMMTAN